MEGIKAEIRRKHLKMFGTDPLLVRSPGRINIIGEHTDYNDGFVLPAAVDKYVYVGVSARADKEINLYSINFDEWAESHMDSLGKASQHWANYVLGVAYEMKDMLPQGFDLTIYGDVPIGAGMASSAALESAVGFALNAVFDLGLDRMDLAKIGQRCEHRYIGVKCGIMDQFASLFGREGHVVRLDCRDLSYVYVPMALGDYVLLLLNTNVKHSLASSAYNQRREKCEQAVKLLQEVYPEIQSLRDVNVEMLEKVVQEKDREAYMKARFVVEEIKRVEDSCEQLMMGNIDRLGQNMYDTHIGLSRDYEVSCPELDYLVTYVHQLPEVLGARMMGGGFGGCTINIVHKLFVDKLVSFISSRYQEQFGLELSTYKVELRNGTEIIN